MASIVKKAGLVCMSNGLSLNRKQDVEQLTMLLHSCGIESVSGKYLFADKGTASGTALQRAQQLNSFFSDSSIDAVFDLSGGDLANEVLPFLDYSAIRNSKAEFWGYSDLTCIINAICALCNKSSVLYTVQNLLRSHSVQQFDDFKQYNMAGSASLFSFPVTFIQGDCMEGTLAGGNVRCLLKLAGTPYFPNLSNSIILLEAQSGKADRISAYFAQLAQIGVFSIVSGVLLGTFSELEKSHSRAYTASLLKQFIPADLPLAFTGYIGHNPDSKAAHIGSYYHFSNF